MNRKLSKLIIQTLQFILFAVLSYICWIGYRGSTAIEEKFRFAECFIRCLCYVVFLYFYLKSLSAKFGSNTLLFSLYLLFAVCSEFRILSSVSQVTGKALLDGIWGVRITLFSTIIMFLSLAGYGLFFSNNEHSEISKYIWISLCSGLIITFILPTATDTMQVFTLPHIYILILILFAVTFLIFLLQLLTNTFDSYAWRMVAGLILCVANILNLMFDTFHMNEIGTILTAIGLIIIYTVAKISDITL